MNAGENPKAQTAGEIIKSPAFWEIKFNPEVVAANQARAAEFLKQQQAFKIEELRRAWRAPQRHVTATPDFSGDWGSKFETIRDLMNTGKGVSIALVGERGNGKTQLAVELMRMATGQLKSCLFTTAMSFFIAVKASYRKDADQTEQEIMSEFGKPKFLVIDEIGKRADTEWENNMLFELLNRRYNNMTDTLLICNKAKSEFETYIGPSIASRMNETGGIILCDWPTFRT